MNITQIFKLGIDLAVAADPRGKVGVKKYLSQIKKEYDDLKESEKEYFDTEKLTNPYPDSFIHLNDGRLVKRILAGIDITGAEVLLASQLAELKKPIDLIISHHPNGRSLTNLQEVMEMTVGMYESYGLPVHVAEKIVEEHSRIVSRSLHSMNYDRVIDMAKILQVNLMDTHTITDNLVEKFLTDLLKKKGVETLGDIIKILLEVPEYQQAKRHNAGPKIVAGNVRHHVGKFIIEMTGGTSTHAKLYPEFSKAGFSTMISMHMREESVQKAGESGMNIIITGHMASDSLGMNLFLDELEKKGIEIVPCGGLVRVSRNSSSKKGKKL
jgi:putative NIF3 family GTP cyclohydrolase 1 type 2